MAGRGAKVTSQMFIYCVGAAKSGTSWLFDVLYQHPECYFPAVKELHYWDALESGKGGFYRKRMLERLEWLQGRRRAETDPQVIAYQERSLADIQAWLDTFDGTKADHAAYLRFLGEGREGARVIGDFTPSYALLNTGTFRKMAGLTIPTKFIFVMRDPAERVWSHIRMDAAAVGQEAAITRLDSYLAGGEHDLAARSNYRRTINQLLKVIPREALHLEFYEHLFTKEAIERIFDFLDLAPQQPDFAKRVNESTALPLDNARRAALRDLLKPQYNFITGLMGALPGEWSEKVVSA